MSKILEAVYDYVKEFSGLDEDFIYQGGNNSSALPKAHNRFAVLNLLNIMQIGTNEEEYTEQGVQITSTLQASVHGHNEFAPKDCPCFNVREFFADNGF